MSDSFGFSVYLSSIEDQRSMLHRFGGGTPVFLSLHISEEFGPEYCRLAEDMCSMLSGAGFRIIADISAKTIDQFNEPDLVRLARRLGLWALRVDYGLTDDEIMELARQMPVVLNASTVSTETAKKIASVGNLVMAMHNFYPRPETGLDDGFFRSRTKELRDAGLKVIAFIPGDTNLRGPIHEGLPTLERHRGLPPSSCFFDLYLNFDVDGIFVGDPGISERELKRIERFCDDGVLEIPAELDEEYSSLYGMIFTCRPDSPSWLVRFAESRTYSCFGRNTAPGKCTERVPGSITIDNESYGRYSGEVQLIRTSLPADPRVNVIGKVKEGYLLTANSLRNGERFVLTRN